MVKVLKDIDDETTEVELANGQKIRVPKMFVKKAEGSEAAVKTPTTSGPKPRGSGRAQSAYQFYIEQGLQTHQAAGIVGNLMQESGSMLNPKAVGDQGTAFGIGQWRGQRFANLRRFAAKQGTSWEDTRTQLGFVLHEMGLSNTQDVAGYGSEASAGRQLSASTDVRGATQAMAGFERPRGWKPGGNPEAIHGWNNRLKFAESILGGTPTSSPTGSTFAASGDSSGADQSATDTGTDTIRSKLEKLLRGDRSRSSAPKKRTRGQIVQDAVSAGLMALGGSGQEKTIPESVAPSLGESSQMFREIAASGPLPRLEEAQLPQAPRLGDLI